MKYSTFVNFSFLLSIILLIGSCTIVGGIFKAGMGVGIFLVVAVIVVIGIILAKIRNK